MRFSFHKLITGCSIWWDFPHIYSVLEFFRRCKISYNSHKFQVKILWINIHNRTLPNFKYYFWYTEMTIVMKGSHSLDIEAMSWDWCSLSLSLSLSLSILPIGRKDLYIKFMTLQIFYDHLHMYRWRPWENYSSIS